jgi:hypothetical protein
MSPSGTSAYQPLEPAKRPGSHPTLAPLYRVLVHRQFHKHYEELVERVGIQQAQQLWDHLSQSPGSPTALASTSFLKGKPGRPQGPGWSKTIHYELSSMARVNYQFHNSYTTTRQGDEHRVVAILTINYSSH